MTPIEEIAAERRRQTEAEGYDAAHDDAHVNGDIAKAAAAYAAASVRSAVGAQLWPWRIDEFKPKNGRDSLIKAAALCLAEIERLDRASKTEAAA